MSKPKVQKDLAPKHAKYTHHMAYMVLMATSAFLASDFWDHPRELDLYWIA